MLKSSIQAGSTIVFVRSWYLFVISLADFGTKPNDKLRLERAISLRAQDKEVGMETSQLQWHAWERRWTTCLPALLTQVWQTSATTDRRVCRGRIKASNSSPTRLGQEGATRSMETCPPRYSGTPPGAEQALLGDG